MFFHRYVKLVYNYTLFVIPTHARLDLDAENGTLKGGKYKQMHKLFRKKEIEKATIEVEMVKVLD